MKEIKIYSTSWKLEKMIYGVSDISFIVPLSISQIVWLFVSLLFIITFSDSFPLAYIDNALLKYLVIPIGITWFMSQKTFDDKKPFKYLLTVVLYLFRIKRTYRHQKLIKKRKHKLTNPTIIRRQL